MELTSLLAQFWGLTFVIVGVILLVKKDDRRMIVKMTTDDTAIFFTGFFALILGIAHILIYNVWSSDWTVILTLIGWLTLLKGLMRLAFPVTTKKIIKGIDTGSTLTIWLVIFVIIGLYLIKQGFGL